MRILNQHHPLHTAREDTTMRTTRPIALVASAALLSAALVGCTNPLEQLVQQGSERLVEDAIERETGVEFDVDSGDGASVPSDFPGELPLPEGRLSSAIKTEMLWMLMYEISDIAAAERLGDWYAENGFAEVSVGDLGQLRTWIYESDTYLVNIGTLSSDTTSLQYSVKVK